MATSPINRKSVAMVTPVCGLATLGRKGEMRRTLRTTRRRMKTRTRRARTRRRTKTRTRRRPTTTRNHHLSLPPQSS